MCQLLCSRTRHHTKAHSGVSVWEALPWVGGYLACIVLVCAPPLYWSSAPSHVRCTRIASTPPGRADSRPWTA
eukprot:4204322-Prymnesium_polylepis.1